MPFVARWPRRIKAGTESGELGHTNDLLPTCCAAAGVKLPSDGNFDGLDLLPLLTGNTRKLPRPTVFWQVDLYKNLQRHYPKPKPYATEIARRGQWKLLAIEGKPVELIDVEADIREQNNLLAEKPEIVEALKQELAAWLAEPRQPFGTND